MSSRKTVVEAAGVVDGRGTRTPPGRPAGVLLETRDDRCDVLACGEMQRVNAHPGARGAPHRKMGNHVLMPALVNAHTHLDLSALGSRPLPPLLGFVGWLAMIRRARLAEGFDPAAATELGCRMLRRGGVGAVGDIAGTADGAVSTLRRSGLEGVSFIEAVGMGPRQARAVAHLEGLARCRPQPAEGAVRLGLQPHAPYSAGLEVYHAAARLQIETGLPLATHVGESLAERRFVRDASGPFKLLLRALGLWQRSYLEQIGRGRRPVEHLEAVLGQAGWLLIHVNDCSDDEIDILRRTGAHVVYCPRSSAHLRHDRHLGPHRYREMLAAGINVALGTDSVASLPSDEADRLSPLDEMRLLWRRDATDATTLLAMGTVNGARALGLDEGRFTLSPGPLSGLIGVDVSGTDDRLPPARRVLESAPMPRWVWPPIEEDDA